MCLSVFILEFICLGLCVLLGLEYFLSHVKEVFSHYLFKYFLRSFLSLFFFWDPYNANIGVFNVVPEIYGEEKAMATHSSTLAWEIPWMGEPGRLQSMGLLGVGRLSDFTFTFHFHALEKEMATHSSTLAWEIPWTEECGRLQSMGLQRVGHD